MQVETGIDVRVALFAPRLTRASGGIWQFYQWVARHLQNELSLHLVAPSEILTEIRARGDVDFSGATDSDDILNQVRKSFCYRNLERKDYPRLLGVRPPFYFTACNWIKRNFYHGSCFENAFYENLRNNNLDLVHVPQQAPRYPGAIGKLPYVINPHDYQHEHYPQYFTNDQLILRRENWYPHQRKASAIVVHSLQTRDDVLRYLGVPEEKVFYAPYGPLDTFPVPDEEIMAEIKRTFRLPEKYIFYPARMWQHKNHVALVDAIAHLKKKGEQVDCVFTDDSTEYSKVVHERVTQLGVEDQIQFLGRLDSKQMGAVYKSCTMVVVPSLFEQNSGPMLEAIQLGKPVAVSNLPELVTSLGEGGLVFDGKSIADIAEAITHVWSSDENRKSMETSARKRRSEMSWQPFIEVYKKAYAYALG